MSMKGGAAGPGSGKKKDDLLITENPAFLDESGAFSIDRYLAHILHNQPEERIQSLIREHGETLISSMSTTQLMNAMRQLSRELQDPERGAFAKLGSYPNADGEYEWDDEASRADTELLTAILVDEEEGGKVEDILALVAPEQIEETPALRLSLEHYFKSMMDHTARYMQHAARADRLYMAHAADHAEIDPETIASHLPDFLKDLDEREFLPVVEAVKTVVASVGSVMKSQDGREGLGAALLTFPPFVSPFEKPAQDDTLAAFEDMLQKFKEGAVSVYEIRDLAAAIEDPGLKEICTEVVRKVEEEKLLFPGRSPAEIKARLDFADLQRLPGLARTLEKFEKDLSRQSAMLMENLQKLEQGPQTPALEPALEDTQEMVRKTAELRRALEDFKDAPTPEKYQELADKSQTLEDMGLEAAPELKAYNNEASAVALEHQQALEAQQLQIALQMEQFAPKTSEVSGPAMFGGGDGGGMTG